MPPAVPVSEAAIASGSGMRTAKLSLNVRSLCKPIE